MGAYPWTGSKGHPTAADNLQDTAAYQDGRLVFTDAGTLPGAEPHDYAALVGSTRAPDRRRDRRRLPRPAARRRVPGRRRGRAVGLRRRPARQGRGRPAALPRHGRRRRRRETVWIAVAGRTAGRRRPNELDRGAAGPRRPARGQDRRPRRARRALAASTCPATAGCRRPSTGASRTSPTSRRPRRTCRSASSTRARPTPRRSRRSERATFVGAGYPDYPWLFATDGEYTAFASVALGQFEPIKAHLLALRDVSRRAQRPLAARSRTRSSPTARSTSAPTQDPGNTDESVEVPERRRARVALDR